MSDHEDGSILSASIIEHRPNDVAFDRFFDNLVNFLEENLVSLLLAVRGNLIFSSFNLLIIKVSTCWFFSSFILVGIYGIIKTIAFGTEVFIF